MAYMNAERKAARAAVIKNTAKKYGVKVTLSVKNHSTLVATVAQGKIDFISSYKRSAGESQLVKEREINYIDVNPYWYQEHFDAEAKAFLDELIAAMYGSDYYDDSDSQADYFNCSHYISINVGRWNKPYVLTA